MESNNILQTQSTRRRKQPHILSKVVDPYGQKNSGWSTLLTLMIGLELIDVLVFLVTLNRHIIFQFYIINFATILTMIAFLIIPAIWALVAVTPKRLDYNIRKYSFKLRIKQGKEKISKYSSEASEEAVRGFTGLEKFNPKTGMSEHKINEPPQWSLKKHPYQGNRAFDLIVIPKIVEENVVITANLWEAGKSLPAGCLKKTTMITGQSFSYIMDDVKEQLQDKSISPVRYQALISVWDQYKDRASTLEPVFLIHIGLPFKIREEDSLKEMQQIRDGYESSLNIKGFDTVLLTDPEDLVMIITGMLTGKMFFRGDLVEN